MKQIKILLSFDHELSLGGAESYARNMFDPTDRLIELAGDLQVPVTLFTDVCCAMRFREWDHDGFFSVYCRQLDDLVRQGHDAQLHLHPHWIDSEYREGRFVPAQTYSLGSFEERPWPNNIPGIVSQGIELLDELCRSNPTYKCVAFRAGGFSLSPATPAILSALLNHGIRIESSIAKGFHYTSDLWEVDFRDMPKRANWFIAESGPLNVEAPSGLYEIPIATRPRTPLNNLPFLVKRVLKRRRRYPTGGWPIDTGHVSRLAKLKRLAPRSAWMLGFDHYADDVHDLMKTLHYHIANHPQDETIALSAISHPKYMGDHARSLMKGFVQRVRNEFGDQAEFCSYQQLHDELLPAAEACDNEEHSERRGVRS